MKLLLYIGFTFVCTVAELAAAASLEWVGDLKLPNAKFYALRNIDSDQSEWVAEGGIFLQYTVKGISEDCLVLSHSDGSQITLKLLKPRTKSCPVALTRTRALEILYSTYIDVSEGAVLDSEKESASSDIVLTENERNFLKKRYPNLDGPKMVGRIANPEALNNIVYTPLNKADYDPLLTTAVSDSDWSEFSRAYWSSARVQRRINKWKQDYLNKHK